MRYLLRKFGLLLFTAWVALTLNFFMPRLVPGDPIGAMIAKYHGQLSPQAITALKITYGLAGVQDPLWKQYLHYLGQLLQGNFGRSTNFFPAPVSEIVGASLPWTLGLIGIATILAFLIGSSLGLLSAWRRGGRVADGMLPVALFLNSMPYFWFALIVLYTFSFVLGWFPNGGGMDPFTKVGLNANFFKQIFTHGVLPALTIVVTASGGWLLTMRNNVITVLSEDYVAFARAKGLPERRILTNYVLRNAVLPSLTAFGMALGFVISGSIVTEIVFSYPGLGSLLFQSVVGLDYPLMQAIFLYISLAVLITNFIVDAAYVLLDPRVRDARA
ncbi:MAG TPA: ABC transporter permease [Deinococcales bacterium]|nr:ABC transporter permease [Deinococcales bacterium]